MDPNMHCYNQQPRSSSTEIPTSSSVINERTFISCCLHLGRLLQRCQLEQTSSPLLDNHGSSPRLCDILLDIFEKLQSIVAAYNHDYELLSSTTHFVITIDSFSRKCRQMLTLIASPTVTDKDRRFDETLLALVYLLHELKSLYPNHIYSTSSYRISKPEASNWWLANFADRTIVPWSDFLISFSRQFPILVNYEEEDLYKSIGVTRNNHVSIIEFDLFTRLFQPWAQLMDVWELLTRRHPAYSPSPTTYLAFKSRLDQLALTKGPSSYLFRQSCTSLGQWVIGYVDANGQSKQTMVRIKTLGQTLADGEQRGLYLFPNGGPLFSHDSSQLVASPARLQVTQEQDQPYRDMGSNFELCKICAENDKDIRLEPCGHLICKSCLASYQMTNSRRTNHHLCPYCRVEIKGLQEVVIEGYQPPVVDSRPPPVPPRLLDFASEHPQNSPWHNLVTSSSYADLALSDSGSQSTT